MWILRHRVSVLVARFKIQFEVQEKAKEKKDELQSRFVPIPNGKTSRTHREKKER